MAQKDRSVGMTLDLTIDRTREYDYAKLVQEEVSEYSQVEVTEDLRLGGIHAQAAWGYWFEYLTEQVWKTNFGNEVVGHVPRGRTSNQPFRVLSLGCGHGGLELEIAE